MSQLTTQQLCEHCNKCGHDRARHYGYTGQDGMCDRCYCPGFQPSAVSCQPEPLPAVPPRILPSTPIDEYQRCRCLCPRGEHEGPLNCSGVLVGAQAPLPGTRAALLPCTCPAQKSSARLIT